MTYESISNTKRISYYIAALGALLSVFIFQYISDQRGFSSIPMYLGSCALFVLSFGICFHLANRILKRTEISKKTFRRLLFFISITVILFSLIWMFVAYKYEITEYSYYTENSNRHVFGTRWWFLLLIFTSFLMFFIARSASFSVKISKVLRFAAAAVFVFLQAKCLFHPNLFRGGEGISDLYHMDAYTASIVNLCNGAAYSPHLNANYGRYGFFYLPLVKVLSLFMNQWFAVSMAVAIIGALMFVLLYVLLDKLIDNDVVFLLAVFASGMPTFAMVGHQMYEVYYQVLPHRMLLQVIGLVAFYYIIKNNSRRKRTLMWVVASLGLIWNLETGIVFLIAWALLDLALKFLENSWKQMVHVLFMIPLAVLSAYLIMNFLNLLCGGEWLSFGFFGYPYLPNSQCSLLEYCKKYLWIIVLFFAIGILISKVIKKESAYRFVFIGFFGITVIGISFLLISKSLFITDESSFGSIYNGFAETYEGPFSGGFLIAGFFLLVVCCLLPRFFGNKISDKGLFLIMCAILGLGCLTYHYEYSIPFSLILILPEALITFSLIFDKMLRETKEKINAFSPEVVLSGLVVIFLSCMVMESLFSLPTKWHRESEGVWVTEGSNEFITKLDNSLPEETMCFGVGVPLVCAYMNRDPQVYVQEYSNQTKEGNNYLEEAINSGDYKYIFTMVSNSEILDSKYEMIEKYDYMDRGEFVFGLFRRR